MNKQEFLSAIEEALHGVPEEEKKEILYDYEEHFMIGSADGKTEEQICSELGNPREIANNYINNSSIKIKETNKNTSNFIIPLISIGIIAIALIAMLAIKLNTHKKDQIVINPNSDYEISVGSDGVKIGGMSIDSTGIHSDGLNIDSTGIHGDGVNIDNNGVDVNLPNVNINVGNISSGTKVNQNKNLSLTGISKINFNVESANVNFINYDGSSLKIELTGSVSDNLKPVLEAYTKESVATVELKLEDISQAPSRSSNLKLDVYIPSNYSEDLELDTESGNVDLSNFNLNKLSLDIASGNLNINNLIANTLEIMSQSGGVSGDSVVTKASNITAESGNIEINGLEGSLMVKKNSGNIRLGYEKFTNSLTIDCESGNVDVRLPSNSQFKLNASTESGNIAVNFPITNKETNSQEDSNKFIKGNIGISKNTIAISCSSGNINID